MKIIKKKFYKDNQNNNFIIRIQIKIMIKKVMSNTIMKIKMNRKIIMKILIIMKDIVKINKN